MTAPKSALPAATEDRASAGNNEAEAMAWHEARAAERHTPPDRTVLLSIALAGFPPSPNTTRREHFHTRSDEAAQWRNDARLVALQALREHEHPNDFPLRKASLELVAVGVRIDPDGCMAACKPVIDGLVDAGVLQDDSWRTLDGLSVRWEPGDRGLRIDILTGWSR